MDSKILERQNPQTHKPFDKKFGVGDYVSDDSPHAKTNKRPSTG